MRLWYLSHMRPAMAQARLRGCADIQPSDCIWWHFTVRFIPSQSNKWASSWDYGSYHIGDQWWLRWACASAQYRQSLRCSHTWSMEVDGEYQITDIQPHWMAAHARLKNEFTEDEQYHNLMKWFKCSKSGRLSRKTLLAFCLRGDILYAVLCASVSLDAFDCIGSWLFFLTRTTLALFLHFIYWCIHAALSFIERIDMNSDHYLR